MTIPASSSVETATITSSIPATGSFLYIWLLIALPFLGFAVLMLAGRRSNKWGHLLGCATVIASFILGLVLFFALLGLPAQERSVEQKLYTWQLVGRFQADVAFQLDTLSMTFVLLITGVGALIHIYSIGYMAHDPERRKFFAFLNLFVASMLLLVLANNYLLLYVGWEGVGVASYLLIGFWQYKPSAAAAAKKAFVVNRVGDMGLSLAIMLMFATFGTFAFTQVFDNADKASSTTLTVIGLLLLLAAVGKSAQFPLQSWLFDAMEGPTPVSALIHAATMVTAGVYLIVRSNAIFNLTPTARTFVIVVGCISLIAGAIIGSSRDEIKKALAGSTMSQIGYMVVAAGLGPVGYVFAIFQLVTHGMFKADLFLGAGSVMHGMNNEENMRRYGALRKVMLVTFITFTSGYLAIMGIPPFSAFYSKDHIIEAAFGQNFFVGLVTLIGAGLTAVYMTRIFVLTFLGKARWPKDAHPHESPPVMLVPMIVLAIGAFAGGFLLAYGDAIENWLEPVTGYTETHLSFPVWALEAVTLAFVLLCVAITARQYARDVPLTAPTAVSPLTRAARQNLYGDAFNEAVFMRPGQYLTRSLVWADKAAVDGVIVGGTVGAVAATSRFLKGWQDGYARRYALTMLGGTLLVLAAMLLVRL